MPSVSKVSRFRWIWSSRPFSIRSRTWKKPNYTKQKRLMNRKSYIKWTAILCAVFIAVAAQAADKPNILFIVSDDTGYGDLGPYGGGEGRGMPTPNIDRLAAEGMTFFSYYAQPSCTPGRAAMITGRIPNRSGMTTVAFQGQGGGLP